MALGAVGLADVGERAQVSAWHNGRGGEWQGLARRMAQSRGQGGGRDDGGGWIGRLAGWVGVGLTFRGGVSPTRKAAVRCGFEVCELGVC